MNDKHENAPAPLEEERALKHLLEQWQAPAAPSALEQRVLAAYRARFDNAPVPFWKRLLTTSIRVPLPAAVSFAALLLLALWGAARPVNLILPTSTNALATTRVIEVPVIKEKAVTQTIYLPARTEALKQRRIKPSLALQSASLEENYFTRAPRLALAGFEPNSELKIRVIKGETTNEK